jgi:phosphonatase-like hydrolase
MPVGSRVTGPRLVVCDLAGTTIRDRGEVVAAFTSALAEAGIQVTAAQLMDVRGSSKRQAVGRFIPEGPDHARRVEASYNSFRGHLSDHYRLQGVEPIEGAEETFGWLRRKGIRVALNTGFERDITDLLLGALGWDRGTVDAIVAGDDVAHGRPAPDLIVRAMQLTGVSHATDVMNVGDTVLDMQAGQHAGVGWNIAVLTGAHSKDQLELVPHTHLIDSIADLPALVESRSPDLR